MKKFRVGIVGIGFIGAVHIEQLRRLGNVDVVAITDSINAQQKAEQYFVPKGYNNFKDMINNENLDCIHICTPNNTHYEIAMYAMKNDVNVVCEKPMTCTVEEAQEMSDYAKEHGLVNAMNFNCRFYPLVYQMHSMVKKGDLGDVYTIHGGYLQDWLFFDTDYSWRLDPKASGKSRAFADIGSHWIDMVEFITGLKAVEVLADFEIFHKTRKKPLKAIDTYSGMTLKPEDYEEVEIETEDYATVLFHMNNGAHACCNISQVFAGRKNSMTVSVSGSKCSLSWDSEKSNSLWIGRRDDFNGEVAKDPSLLNEDTSKVISYPGGHVEGFPDTFKQNFKKIYAAIAGSKDDKVYATFNDGLREMQLCDKVIESAQKRCWISLD